LTKRPCFLQEMRPRPSGEKKGLCFDLDSIKVRTLGHPFRRERGAEPVARMPAKKGDEFRHPASTRRGRQKRGGTARALDQRGKGSYREQHRSCRGGRRRGGTKRESRQHWKVYWSRLVDWGKNENWMKRRGSPWERGKKGGGEEGEKLRGGKRSPHR